MTGVRPGIYWQIMWRFVSPALMLGVIGSSIYFMLRHKPTYTAWDETQVTETSINCQICVSLLIYILGQLFWFKYYDLFRLGVSRRSIQTGLWPLLQSSRFPAWFPSSEVPESIWSKGEFIELVYWFVCNKELIINHTKMLTSIDHWPHLDMIQYQVALQKILRIPY